MEKNVGLYYINDKNEIKHFEYSTILPFLWQETYSVELLEKQETIILEALQKGEKVKLIVPIETAIQNLERKIKSISSETPRKKTLRKEFLDFLKKEVKTNSNLEISLEGLIDFYANPNELVKDLKEFHTNQKKRFAYQKEKVSFRSIGYNDDFLLFSSTYQFLMEETEIQSKINEERRLNLIQNKGLTKEMNQKADKLFLVIISVLLFFIGVYLFARTNLTQIGILSFLSGLILGIYLFLKQKKKI